MSLLKSHLVIILKRWRSIKALPLVNQEPSHCIFVRVALKYDMLKGLHNVWASADMTKSKFEIIEKRLKMIEGADAYEFGDATGLCLVLDIAIPSNCQNSRNIREPHVLRITLPCTEKDGSTCSHEKLLMHFFQR